MKYGIIVGGRVTEPVTIPPARESDPLVWLGIQFPGYTGWERVSDDAVPGATYNGPGSSTNPVDPSMKPRFKTLSGSTFIAMAAGAIGFDRMDQLIAKSKSVEILITKAEKVDRLSGNMPAAIARLKQGANALTDAELALIDAAWGAIV